MISVIIVAYNEEHLIESIINEIKKQNFNYGYEIILADGNSNDNTVQLASYVTVDYIKTQNNLSKSYRDHFRRKTDIEYKKFKENLGNSVRKAYNQLRGNKVSINNDRARSRTKGPTLHAKLHNTVTGQSNKPRLEVDKNGYTITDKHIFKTYII